MWVQLPFWVIRYYCNEIPNYPENYTLDTGNSLQFLCREWFILQLLRIYFQLSRMFFKNKFSNCFKCTFLFYIIILYFYFISRIFEIENRTNVCLKLIHRFIFQILFTFFTVFCQHKISAMNLVSFDYMTIVDNQVL